jgi:hypothetical protein
MTGQTTARKSSSPSQLLRAAFHFPPPAGGRSRYECAGDLAAMVDRAVLAELHRLREQDCSIHAIARLTGLETMTIASLLNETGERDKTICT